MTDKQRIEKVLMELENDIPDFSARFNFWCCQSCGHAAMENNGRKNYIFCHEQSVESAFGVEYETYYFDEDGCECGYDDYVDLEDVVVGVGDDLQDPLHFHHHFEDPTLKPKVVEAFNKHRFLVEWKGMPDDKSIVIHN